jgi:hypothetical protein
MGVQLPASHDSRVPDDVTIAVSPDVSALHAGRLDGVLASIATVYAPFAGRSPSGDEGAAS